MPGNAIAPFIGKSGEIIFFLLGDGTPDDIWTSQADDPSYAVNGGGSIALTGRTAYPITAGFGPPYVSYSLATKIEPSDVVTFSADAGWVSFGASGVAPAAIDEPVTNWSGQEMFPITEPKTLRLGMNLTGPHPTQPVDIIRNMIGHTNGGGGVISTDANFRPTAISGNAWYNTQNRNTSNGLNSRGTGGVEGIYTDTWYDYSVGRDKLSWIEAHDPDQTIVIEIGSKVTLETTGSYTKYRRRFQISFNPTRTVDYLGFNTFFDSVDVKDIEVVGPWNDPDSTEYIDGYTKSVLSGISRLRFSQCGEAINSNAATYADCRQPDDLSTGLFKNNEAQLIKVEPITLCMMTWNGDTFSIADKWTLVGTPNTDPTFIVGIKCTTSAPHGFSSLQGVDFRSIYNLDFAKPTDAADHCGMQVNGISGSIWMPFHQISQTPIWVTGPDTFICYPSFIVATAGVADPIGTQNFDGTVSTLGVYVRRIGMIAYEKQIIMASEMEPPCEAHINLSECMTDDGVFDLATSVLATYQALSPERRPPHIDVEIGDEWWNPGWLMFSRMVALSHVIGHGVTPGASRQCSTYVAHRLTKVFQDVFIDGGFPGVVRKGCWFQRFGDVELPYAQSQGYTFEVGGCSAYYFSTFPYNSWSAYTSVDQLHDLWQWMLKYVVVNQLDTLISTINTYMPGMELVAYEGGEDQYSPGPFDAAEMTDFYYGTRNYETVQATLINAQRAGFDQVNLYTYQNAVRTDTGTTWQHSMNNVQVPGLGVSPPNVTVAAMTGDDNLDLINENTKLLAVIDWIAGSPTPTILTPGVASLGTRTPTSISMTSTNATGGTPPYSYEWQISTNSGSTWNPATGLGVTTLSTTITGLTPGTSYEIRLQYTDSGS